MDELSVARAIEERAAALDAEAETLRPPGAHVWMRTVAPDVRFYVKQEIARELHALAARIRGDDR